MKLHASGEDYLEAILVLQRQKGMVRSVDVARHLEVTKPPSRRVATALQTLGFVTSRCRATSTERTMPFCFCSTRMASR